MTSGDPLDMAYKRGHRTLEKLDRVLLSHVQGKSLPLSLSLLLLCFAFCFYYYYYYYYCLICYVLVKG